MSRGHPHVHRQILDGAQQFGLCGHRQLRHFFTVESRRNGDECCAGEVRGKRKSVAAIGVFEPAEPPAHTGSGAVFDAEELRLVRYFDEPARLPQPEPITRLEPAGELTDDDA